MEGVKIEVPIKVGETVLKCCSCVSITNNTFLGMCNDCIEAGFRKHYSGL